MAHAFRVQMEHIHLGGQRLVRPVPDCHQMQNGRVLQHQIRAHGRVIRGTLKTVQVPPVTEFRIQFNIMPMVDLVPPSPAAIRMVRPRH